MTAKFSESDLAAIVAVHLEGEGWDYFAEVQVEQGDKRADLVATHGRRVMVVETKLTLSIDVLSQALNWLPHAHHVVIAVPARKDMHSESSRLTFVIEHLKRSGIGLWFVDMKNIYKPVREVLRPQLHRYADGAATRIRESLVDEMRHDTAGAKTPGQASTPFKRTCLELRRHVKANPGRSFDEAMGAIRHHYGSTRSARSSLDLILRIAGLVMSGGKLYVEGAVPEPATLPAPVVQSADEFSLTPPKPPAAKKAPAAPESRVSDRRTSIVLLRCQACRKPILVADQDKVRAHDAVGYQLLRNVWNVRDQGLPYTIEYHRPSDMKSLAMCTCSGR